MPPRPLSPPGGTGRVLVAWELMPIQGPSGWSAAMRSWGWGSAARYVGKARYMPCLLAWRYASTARPCSAPYATS